MHSASAIWHAAGKLHKPSFRIAPETHIGLRILGRDDSPDAPIACRHGTISLGWLGSTSWVRMIITDHLRPATPSRAMRIDQSLRIDLEMSFRLGVDIRGWFESFDAIALPQQDPAAFVRMHGAFLGSQRVNHFPCHLDIHRAWA